jgi:hypothetical protein
MKPILADLGLVTQGDERAFAVTSPDDRYRYVLGRYWSDTRPLWCVCGINPSKARHNIDDHTVTKIIGFAKRNGAGGFVLVNALAYSETDQDEVVRAHRNGVDVRGEHNSAVMCWATFGRAIAAWGKIPPKLRSVAQRGIGEFCVGKIECFGVNSDESPRHPLMLGYNTPIVPLSEARDALRAGFKNGLRPLSTPPPP